jgi:hypothetical protein
MTAVTFLSLASVKIYSGTGSLGNITYMKTTLFIPKIA